MAWWIWVLIVIGVIVGSITLVAIISTMLDWNRAKKDPTYLDNKIQRLQEGIEQDQERIRQSDNRKERHREQVKRNNEWIARNKKQMEKDKAFVAKNDKSMRDIAQLKLLIQQGVFNAEEVTSIESLANNPVFDEFVIRTNLTTAAYNENSKILESDTKLTNETTKVLLGNLGGNEKSDVKLAELDKQLQESSRKMKEQEKEILELEAHAAELHPEIDAIDAEIAKWLELGQSRAGK